MPDIEFFDTSDLYTEEISLRLDRANQEEKDIPF